MSEDLGGPFKSLLATMTIAQPCRVCGKPRTAMAPLANLVRVAPWKPDGPHADCDRQEADWERQATTAADKDPDYLDAVGAAEDAQFAAERIWEAKVRTLGLPDWIVERAIASHQQGWRDE